MENRYEASIISRPLFIIVAESTEIFAPMLQLGWASACSRVATAMVSRVHDRNGPPEAVRIRRRIWSTAAGANTWKMAECSESTGITQPPAARAMASRDGPAQTRLSLLARAMTDPALAAASV